MTERYKVLNRLGLRVRSNTRAFHRMVEPGHVDHGYWPGLNGELFDVVQLSPRGPWYVRRVGERLNTDKPMTLREALVRVRLGVSA